MPGFLSKIFRRNKSSGDSSSSHSPHNARRPRTALSSRNTNNTTSSNGRKHNKETTTSTRKTHNNNRVTTSTAAEAVGPQDEEDGFARATTPTSRREASNGGDAYTSTSNTSNGGNREYGAAATTTSNGGHYQMTAASSRLRSPSPAASNHHSSINPRRRAGPVDLDDTDFEESDTENMRSATDRSGLSFQQLQQFDALQHNSSSSKDMRPQQLYVMNDAREDEEEEDHAADKSESSTSEFNLSTDAEDEEYNAIKRMSRVQQESFLNQSGMSSPATYTTDEDHAIFPALHTDDEGTITDPSTVVPDEEPGPVKIVSMMTVPNISTTNGGAPKTEDDMLAWGVASGKNASNRENGASHVGKPKSRRGDAPPGEDFFATANFANFDDVPFDAFENPFPTSTRSLTHQQSQQRPGEPKRPKSTTAESIRHRSSSARRYDVTKDATAKREPELHDLLNQANRVGNRSKRHNERSSSSVNSAPAITTQYIRQYRGLSRGDARSATGPTTSVSDIIESLEATNAARVTTQRSVGSAGGANTSVRMAKDRIRERRRREREASSSRHRSKSSEIAGGSDESGEENDTSDNWLIEGVAGALGPRAVGADIDSLSGRSNRSRGSRGDKSYRSHRSHRSHRSSRRSRSKKSSSNESVDSKGSRNSKNSRNSRYSHRSTRSYLSQMSQESRSVANDLLRLEMQLAMVGSQEGGTVEAGKEETNGRSGGSTSGSVGGASRTSRTSRTSRASSRRSKSAMTKRSKITVTAPPGKLGIILANKADSKGTVVSGVRTSSVLSEKIAPGDRIVAIDGEDVSRMTVSEITTIMARKTEFERMLTVLTTPKHMTRNTVVDYGSGGVSSGGTASGGSSSGLDPEGSYSSTYGRR